VAADSSLAGGCLCVVRGTGLPFTIGLHLATRYGPLSAWGLVRYRLVSSD